MDLPHRITDHTACPVGTRCATDVLVRLRLQERTYIVIIHSADLSWPAGRVLQSSASASCPRCRQPLGNADISGVPRNCDLLEMIDNHRQQQQQQLQEAVQCSEISPEDLQLTDEVIGWGATGVVRRGVLAFRDNQLKVSFGGMITPNKVPVFEAANMTRNLTYILLKHLTKTLLCTGSCQDAVSTWCHSCTSAQR